MGGKGRRAIRLAQVADGQVTDVTDGRFTDSEPVSTLDGKYLAFVSMRSFDPVYDAHFFDLSFPYGARPYLVPLAAPTSSPFGPQLGGRPIGAAGPAPEPSASAHAGRARDSGSVPVAVDTDGIAERVVAVPVPESRYARLRAVRGGLVWLREPVTGALGIGGGRPDDERPRPVLERFAFARREVEGLTGDVDWFEASKDGTRLVVSDHGALRVIPAERKAADDNPDDTVTVDASRARFTADPASMWLHAYAEAGRIMRHDFWFADMADVDWDAIQDEYRPLLDRISTRTEFTGVLWELFGELGTSHAYVRWPTGPSGNATAGLLGADFERTGETWRIARVVRGDTSDPQARSPPAAPGAAIGTASIKILGLGPVIGARTWGGVIGYDDDHELVDGTTMTVPRLAFWFDVFGWGVENHGVDPDVEVIPAPDDWRSGRDVQLETAVRLALEALQERPAVRPPDPSTRPSRRRPPLPPR